MVGRLVGVAACVLVWAGQLPVQGSTAPRAGCDTELQQEYCQAWWGGDLHTACRWCGRGSQCPAGELTGRAITSQALRSVGNITVI